MKKLLLTITKAIENAGIKKSGDKVNAPFYHIETIEDSDAVNGVNIELVLVSPREEWALDRLLKAVNAKFDADDIAYELWGVRKSQSRVRGQPLTKHFLVLEYRGVVINQEDM